MNFILMKVSLKMHGEASKMAQHVKALAATPGSQRFIPGPTCWEEWKEDHQFPQVVPERNMPATTRLCDVTNT